MKVLLFGLPLSAHRRLKEDSGDWQEAVPEPHTFSSTPTDTNEHTPVQRRRASRTQGRYRERALRTLLSRQVATGTKSSAGFNSTAAYMSRDYGNR